LHNQAVRPPPRSHHSNMRVGVKETLSAHTNRPVSNCARPLRPLSRRTALKALDELGLADSKGHAAKDPGRRRGQESP
jgi:hypothetical protein